MISLTILLLTFIVSLSFPLGILLYHLTKEEYTLGKTYYLWLSRLALFGLFLFFILTYYNPLGYSDLIISLFLMGLGFYLTMLFSKQKVVSLTIFLSLNHLLIYSLIFIYLLALGTIKAPQYRSYGIRESIVGILLLVSLGSLVLFIPTSIFPYFIYYGVGSLLALIKEKT